MKRLAALTLVLGLTMVGCEAKKPAAPVSTTPAQTPEQMMDAMKNAAGPNPGGGAATEAPATEAPATEAPATEAPATEAPATEAPATEAPAAEAPATEAPPAAPANP